MGGAEDTVIAPAALRDVAGIARMYRAQSPASRRLYHPLPFDQPRLSLVLAVLVLLHRSVRLWVRLLPAAAVLLYVARSPRDGEIVAMGSARFHRNREVGRVASTGLYVRPTSRRAGLGYRLALTLARRCQELGARRAEALVLPENTASVATHESVGYVMQPTVYHDRRLDVTDYLLGTLDLTRWAPPAA